MLAQIHTIHSSNNTLTIHASRLENVTVKNEFGTTFRNVNCIYYTVKNHLNGEEASYAEIETMPNTLTHNLISFMYGKMQHYMEKGWAVYYGNRAEVFPA